VVHGYAEVVYEEIAGNEELLRNTVFFIPERAPGYIDNMCILKGSKRVDLAHKFINFIHRPEIYAEFTDAFGFPASVNPRAEAYKQEPSLYTLEDIINAELKDDLGEALELYNAAWESIKVGF
jgi:spermidine/putrescine transport system substrate-binding protein